MVLLRPRPKYAENPDLQHDLDTSNPVSDLLSSNHVSTLQTVCTCLSCSGEAQKAFQPTSREILASLAFNGRSFVAKWFEQYPWLTVLPKGRFFVLNVDILQCMSCLHLAIIAVQPLLRMDLII